MRLQAKAALFGMVAAPDPDECVRQRLIKDATIAVASRAAENESMVVTLCLQCSGGTLARHDPVVMRFLGVFGANIVFGYVGEDAQRLLLSILDQLHA